MDPILTAGSGWAGAGLLGMVVWWLLCRHLPALLEHHERHAAQPRSERAEIVMSDPAVRLAMLDRDHPDPTIRAAAQQTLAAARQTIGN